MMPEPGSVVEWSSAIDQAVVDGALTFARPGWFYALILAPLAGLLFCWSWLAARRRAGLLVSDRLRVLLVREHPPWQALAQMSLLVTALVLLVTALARPQKGFIEARRLLQAANIVFLMDTSRSMLAGDETPNRLERARLAAQSLSQLSRAALEDTVKRVPNECFHWPLGLGIFCLAAGLLMSGVVRVSD